MVTLAQLAIGRSPSWLYAGTLGIGLAIGGARGLRIPLKVDRYWSLIQLRPAAKRGLLWVAAIVATDAALECGAAFARQPLDSWRFVGALAVVACTGMLWGRATMVAVRMHHAPHVDL